MVKQQNDIELINTIAKTAYWAHESSNCNACDAEIDLDWQSASEADEVLWCGIGRAVGSVLLAGHIIPSWQPAVTAPKDGSKFLFVDALNGGAVGIAFYNVEAKAFESHYRTWLDRDCYTHWMPLPKLPDTHIQITTTPAQEEGR